MREVLTGNSSLAAVGIEWILSTDNTLTASKSAEDLAGIVDHPAIGVGSISGEAVPILELQSGLQSVVDGERSVGTKRHVAEVAILVARRKAGSPGKIAGRHAGRNHIGKPGNTPIKTIGNDWIQSNVAIDRLELSDGMVTHVSHLASYLGGNLSLYAQRPLLSVRV